MLLSDTSSIHFSPRWLLLVAVLCLGCAEQKPATLFTPLDASHTHVTFENTVVETESLHVILYEYLYNGAGVAVGDLNNDGLPDLYFSGNTAENRLYLNQGNFVFEDVTATAGVAGKTGWKTGVSMADVNGDGWLDLYVCYSGPGDLDRANQLFINNATDDPHPTFSEQAQHYGLDAPGTFTTQSAFFDYDLDGDLDLFLLNHASTFYSPFFNTTKLRQTRHPHFGNRLYRNDDGHFTDVSTPAGIHGSGINHGLGLSISDLNNDGYPDIYVTNDFEEQDYCYLNTQDGRFQETLQQSFGHLSRSSMGVDIADFNNDLRPDVLTLDMLPEDNRRQKLLRGPDEYEKYQLVLDSGYGHQQMRNMLHLNQGTTTDRVPLFSEIGQLAGVSNTDWSWAALLADYDLDGDKDLFISNGYLRDFTNLDFLKYDFALAREQAMKAGKALYTADGQVNNAPILYELTKHMPSTQVSDYLFSNQGDLTFSNQTKAWGLDAPHVTTGAAYADLDNDGDLDLITNRTNEQAGIYRNNSRQITSHHYLKIKLEGTGKNRFGTGAKVFVSTEHRQQLVEAMPVRGYLSSVEPVLHVGLGSDSIITEIKVVWPGGQVSRLTQLSVDTTLTVQQASSASPTPATTLADTALFFEEATHTGLAFTHQENDYVDFNAEPLVLGQLSRQGPKLAVADVNGDGREDVFIGGAAGQSGQLFLQTSAHTFQRVQAQPWEADRACEDVGVVFFDADGDHAPDLYVVSGGNEFPLGSPLLQDRLYLNDGQGSFAKAPSGSIPVETASGSCVAAADYDQDGDLDLYVGGRIDPGRYPQTSPGGILRNDSDRGRVRFTVATPAVCPALKEPGMVMDAQWSDINRDGWPDLLLVGEWMPIRVFENNQGKLKEVTEAVGLATTQGMWNCLQEGDMDNDGDLDYIVGNLGNNTALQASDEQPLTLYAGDFNEDSRIDPIICSYVQGTSYPIASRDELLAQMNPLRKKFRKYADYADATIQDVLTPEQLANASVKQVYTTQTTYLENRGSEGFIPHALPTEAQLSVVQGIVTDDFDGDGHRDILLAGNYYPFRVQYGPSDASMGLLLTGDGKGNFDPQPWQRSGVLARGDVRDVQTVSDTKGIRWVVITKNNDSLQVLRYKNSTKISGVAALLSLE